jgi:adenylate kinase family enzyme
VRPCDTALFYNVPEEVASARILQRAATSHRCDDNAETIKRRFVVFRCAVWHHGL